MGKWNGNTSLRRKENNADFFTVKREFVHVYLMDKGGLHPEEVFRFH